MCYIIFFYQLCDLQAYHYHGSGHIGETFTIYYCFDIDGLMTFSLILVIGQSVDIQLKQINLFYNMKGYKLITLVI